MTCDTAAIVTCDTAAIVTCDTAAIQFQHITLEHAYTSTWLRDKYTTSRMVNLSLYVPVMKQIACLELTHACYSLIRLACRRAQSTCGNAV